MNLPSLRTAFLGVLLVIGLVVLVERLVVTDREAIEGMLEEAVDAVKDREWSRLRPLLSDSFRWSRFGPDEAVRDLEELTRNRPVTVRAVWKAIEPVEDRCVVEVSVTVMPFQALYVVRVVFEREPGGWKVREVQSA